MIIRQQSTCFNQTAWVLSLFMMALMVVSLLMILLMEDNSTTNTSSQHHQQQHRMLPHAHGVSGDDDYYLDDDTNEAERQQQSKLTDIWLMMGIAFGWTVFTVRSAISPLLQRYAKESIALKGNVLETIQTPQMDSSSIPTYQTLVDYIYSYKGSKYHIRKTFTTYSPLENGFANVDVLVLPDDPTSGVLLEQYEKEQAETKAEQEHETLTQNHNNGAPSTRFLSILFGSLLVLLSIVGAVLVILKLPQDVKPAGWISFSVLIVLLWPLSHWLYRISRRCYSISNTQVIAIQNSAVQCGGPESFLPNAAQVTLVGPACGALEFGNAFTTTPTTTTTTTHHYNYPPAAVSSTLGDNDSIVAPIAAQPQVYYMVQLPPPRSLTEQQNRSTTSTVSSLSMKSMIPLEVMSIEEAPTGEGGMLMNMTDATNNLCYEA